MKKTILVFALIFNFGVWPLAADAAEFTFMPYDGSGNKSDVFDLDHNSLYLWGINPTQSLKDRLAAGETITSATLRIEDIGNWDYDDYQLKFYLLDNVKKADSTNSVDIISIADHESTAAWREIPFYDDSNSSYSNRKFQDYILLETVKYERSIGTTPNPIPGPNSSIDYSYSLDFLELTSLAEYLASANMWGNTLFNSTFGIGIDPDCHFFNEGISLVIETEPIPEPATILLLGTGIVGLAGMSRLKRKSA